MIKQIYVCECDICGAVVPAKPMYYRNETDYVIPDNWTHGKNSEMCICPSCAAKLSTSVTYPVTAGDPVPVYGCPSVITIRSESDEFDKAYKDASKHGPVDLDDYNNH